MRLMYKDGKLTAYGRDMARILDQSFPPEKMKEWTSPIPMPRSSREIKHSRHPEKREVL